MPLVSFHFVFTRHKNCEVSSNKTMAGQGQNFRCGKIVKHPTSHGMMPHYNQALLQMHMNRSSMRHYTPSTANPTYASFFPNLRHLLHTLLTRRFRLPTREPLVEHRVQQSTLYYKQNQLNMQSYYRLCTVRLTLLIL